MKLSLQALKERAEGIASVELLENISGGNLNDCHPKDDNLGDFGTYEVH